MSTERTPNAPRTASRAIMRRHLLGSGAMAACLCAAMLVPSHARAQVGRPDYVAPVSTANAIISTGFQGIPDVVVPGSATVVQTATQDFITVNGSEAIINWTPYDRNGTGSIDFLPVGNSAIFSGLADFTVLNRIVPLDGQDIPIARLIELNGQIQSSIFDPNSSVTQQGGNVWFYSPGGILVGSGATINVGSLVLTSRDIDTTGGLFGSTGEIRFRDPAITGSDTAAVSIASGAQIQAIRSISGSAYVAMVAPRIVQAGTVYADGSVALVAAEAADIRINQGLFDINVTVGTGDANGVVHSGTTGGPSQTSADYANRVYMVAVPKNQALTMLLSGDVGFATVANAFVNANGGIVLSAGRNVVGGVADENAPAGAGATASINISGGGYINSLTGSATHDIVVQPAGVCTLTCAQGGTGTIRFGSDVTLSGDRSVRVSASGLQAIVAGGPMSLLSSTLNVGGAIDISATNGGTLTVSGQLLADASAAGSAATADGGATGGTVALTAASGGTIDASQITLRANAFGGSSSLGGLGLSAPMAAGDGGSATGGMVAIAINSGGTLTTSDLTATADANGGNGGSRGGAATGGTVTLSLDATTLNTANITLSADANGGTGDDVSGNGLGGTVALTTANNSSVSSNFTSLSASGRGGSGNQFGATSRLGGNGMGGTASIALGSTNSQGNALGLLTIRADGSGGNGFDANATAPVSGGNGTGGTATLSAANGLTSFIQPVISANGFGGSALGTGNIGGAGTGGTATINVNSGVATLTADTDVRLLANGYGGMGGAQSGTGLGGIAQVNIGSENTLIAANLLIDGSGTGGGSDAFSQSTQADTLIGGIGRGGTARLSNSGRVTAANLSVQAVGLGGAGFAASGAATGGNGTGGVAEVLNSGIVGVDVLALLASGIGGTSGTNLGSTGIGQGGSAALNNLFNGTITVAQGTSVIANGEVDDAGGGANMGATGGLATVYANGSTLTTQRLDIQASGQSVNNSSNIARTSATARGGTAILVAEFGASITTDTLSLLANGMAANATGNAGQGIGGEVELRVDAEASVSVNSLNPYQNTLIVRADGIGGGGSTGGSGVGGIASMSVDGGAITAPGLAIVSADGLTGASSSATAPQRTAQGGTVTISLSQNPASLLEIYGLTARANGSGAFSGAPTHAFGGRVNFANDGGTIRSNTLSLSANGEASTAGNGEGGTIDFTMSDGLIEVDYTYVSAFGGGGFAAAGSDGGNGTGGTINLYLSGGTVRGLYFSADAGGNGGNGGLGSADVNGVITPAGAGGVGYGGNVLAVIDGTTSVELGSMSVSADGYGGTGGDFDWDTSNLGVSGAGGLGHGGRAEFEGRGGALNATNVSVSARASGGDGGQYRAYSGTPPVPPSGPLQGEDPNGGDSYGGTAVVRLYSTVGGRYAIDSSATAGEGGSGFAGFRGGQAIGGISELIVDNFDAGSIAVDLYSMASGGRGGASAQGNGGSGGYGQGGTGRVVVSGVNGRASVRDSNFHVDGYGGSGRSGQQFISTTTGFDGGYGGDGTGGTIEFVAQSGAELTIVAASGEGLIQSIGHGGFGGDGSNNDFGPLNIATNGGNAGFGGVGAGGQILMSALGGTIRTGDSGADLLLNVSGISGDGAIGGRGTIVSVTDPVTGVVTTTGSHGYSTGGTVNFGGDITLLATTAGGINGLIDLPFTTMMADGSYAGRIELLDRAAGAGLVFRDLRMQTSGTDKAPGTDFTLLGSGVYIESVNGAIEVQNDVTALTTFGGVGGRFFIDATTDPLFAATGGLTVGRDFTFSGGAIGGTHHGNPNFNQTAATIRAGTISIISSGSGVAFDSSTLLVAGTRIGISTNQLGFAAALAFGGLQSGGSIELDSGLTLTGNQVRSISFFDSSSVGATNIGTISASTADISSAGNLLIGSLVTTSGDALLSAVGNLVLNEGQLAQNLFATSTGGNVELGQVTAAGNIGVDASGAITIGQLTTLGRDATLTLPALAGTITLAAGGIVTLGVLDGNSDISIDAATLAGATSSLIAGGLLHIVTTGNLALGTAQANTINLDSGGTLQFSSLRAFGSATARSVGTLTGGSIFTDNGDAALVSTAGDIILDNGDIGGAFSVDAFRDVLLGTFISDFDSSIRAGRNARAVSITTVGAPNIDAAALPGVPLGQANGSGSSDIIFNVVGDLSLGTLDSIGSISITAATLSGATSQLRSVGPTAITTTGGATFGTLDAATALINSGALTFTRSTTNGDTTINASGHIAGGTLASNGGSLFVTTTNASDIVIGTVRAFGNATLTSARRIDIDSLTTNTGSALIDTVGDAIIDVADIGDTLAIDSDANVVIGTTISVGATRVRATGDISALSITTKGADSSSSSSSTTSGPALIRLSAGGAVSLGALNSADLIDINAATLTGASSSLRAVGNVGINTSGAATFGALVGQSALVTAGGPLTFTSATTVGDAALSSGGAVIGSLVETTGSGSIATVSGATVNVATIRAAGDARLSATAGALVVGSLASGGLVSATGQSVNIGGSTNLDFSTLTATAGDAVVNLPSGALRVRSGMATGNLTLTTGTGSMVIDAASAAAINLNSGSTISLVGPITATGLLSITSRRSTGVNGVATGQTVRIASGDIAIGSAGRIGTAGTTMLVDLTNSDTSSRTFIGGESTTSGYSLSASELLRVFGGNIAIHAPRASTQGGTSLGSTRPPDVVIGAFTLNGGGAATGNLGSSGTLSIDTPGSARVNGAVLLNGMTASNGFRLSASEAIEVILGQGSIRLSNGTALSGLLTLESDDIAVATSAAISDIASATTIDAIDARLAANDGVLSDEGALAAGTISFSVIDGLYIQNSGATDQFADRRGFTANSVNIETESGSTRIVVNGRVADDSGVLRTGIDAIEQIMINGIAANLHTANGGGFDAGSTVNGCIIVQSASCSVGFILPPVQDVIQEVVNQQDDSGVTGDSDAMTSLVEIRDVTPLPNEPLVDDPVTGTGNDDLWTAPEE